MNSKFLDMKNSNYELNKFGININNQKPTNKTAVEEDEFWKDCLEQTETKTSTHENRENRSKTDNEEIYLTCNYLLNQSTN